MKIVSKILGKLSIPILFIVILLFLQAYCDLSLPDYTANIINNGISRSGVDSNVPEVMRKNYYEGLLLSIDDKHDDLIKNSYQLISEESLRKKEYEEYLKKYPILKDTDLYVLKDVDKETIDNLDKVLESNIAVVGMLATNDETIAGLLKITIVGDTNLLDTVNNGGETYAKTVFKELKKSTNVMDPSIREEYNALFIKEEYKTVGINLDKYQFNYIVENGIIMLIISIVSLSAAILFDFLLSKASSKFTFMLRNKLVEKIMSFSAKEFNDFSVASLITRSTNDLMQIEQFFMMFFRIALYAPILGIGAFLKLTNNGLNYVVGIGLLAMCVVMILLFIFVVPSFKKIQALLDKLNLVSREILTGLPVIKVFGTQKKETDKFDKANKELTKKDLFVTRIMGSLMPLIMLIMNVICILIIWYGAKKIDAGSLQIGNLVATLTYAMQVLISFIMISLIAIILPRAIVSFKRINEIFKTKNSVTNPVYPEEFDKELKGEIEFKNVGFKYANAEENVLSNISFKASIGMTVAVIGTTGSGKSTLVNLIPRFFDVTSGSILIDGKNIKYVDIKNLRDKIGYVPQKSSLFNGTIATNVKLGKKDLTMSEVSEALKLAKADEFVSKLEKKENSLVSQAGKNLSGGQKGRIAIARAVAAKPEFYIFDDSFSALDFTTDSLVRKNLKNITKKSTVFIVAQRISTILHADLILVLDGGKLVGKGTHEELMKKCQVYKEIALSQLKESEL